MQLKPINTTKCTICDKEIFVYNSPAICNACFEKEKEKK